VVEQRGLGQGLCGASHRRRTAQWLPTSSPPPPTHPPTTTPRAQLVNGFNIGRFWESQGPQHALYVPAPLLREGANDVIVFNQPEAGQPQPSNPTANWFSGPMFTAAAAVEERPAPRQVAPRALLTAAAPVPAPVNASNGAACTSNPQAGLILTLQTCASAGAAATQWNWLVVNAAANAGALQLAAAPALCVGMNGTNPASGYPYLVLEACGGPTTAAAAQHWLYMTPTGGQVRACMGKVGEGGGRGGVARPGVRAAYPMHARGRR
jgi:hypothetical protein